MRDPLTRDLMQTRRSAAPLWISIWMNHYSKVLLLLSKGRLARIIWSFKEGLSDGRQQWPSSSSFDRFMSASKEERKRERKKRHWLAHHGRRIGFTRDLNTVGKMSKPIRHRFPLIAFLSFVSFARQHFLSQPDFFLFFGSPFYFIFFFLLHGRIRLEFSSEPRCRRKRIAVDEREEEPNAIPDGFRWLALIGLLIPRYEGISRVDVRSSQ